MPLNRSKPSFLAFLSPKTSLPQIWPQLKVSFWLNLYFNDVFLNVKYIRVDLSERQDPSNEPQSKVTNQTTVKAEPRDQLLINKTNQLSKKLFKRSDKLAKSLPHKRVKKVVLSHLNLKSEYFSHLFSLINEPINYRFDQFKEMQPN